MTIQYYEDRARTLRGYLQNPYLRDKERQVIQELLYFVEQEMEALDAKAEEERVDGILQAFERR